MSDTPRTDAVLYSPDVDAWELARTLERELAAERQRIKQLEDALYLSRRAHDIAESELAAMKGAA